MVVDCLKMSSANFAIQIAATSGEKPAPNGTLCNQGTTSQAAEKLRSGGGGGFNPRIKRVKSMSALAADGLFLNPFTQNLEFFRSDFSRAKKGRSNQWWALAPAKAGVGTHFDVLQTHHSSREPCLAARCMVLNRLPQARSHPPDEYRSHYTLRRSASRPG